MSRRSSSMFWPILLIGLGVIFLLANLIPNIWSLVCPLALIGAGLFMLFGSGVIPAGETRTDRFTAPVGGATSAQVDIGLSVGEGHVYALADSDNLIDAEVTYVGAMDFAVSGETEKRVRLRQAAGSFWGWLNPAQWVSGAGRALRWHVGLSPRVPMALTVSGGVGRSQLDLRALRVTDLHIGGGAGEMSAVLPAPEAGYTALINGGTGRLEIEAPDGASVGMRVTGGAGAVALRIGEGAAVNAHVSGGVGQVVIEVPRDAAVRLRAQTGLGGISVPAHFVRLSGGETSVAASGAWETPGFDAAERQIDIEFSGGVGGLTVR